MRGEKGREGKGEANINVRGGVAGKKEGSGEGEKGGKKQRSKERAEEEGRTATHTREEERERGPWKGKHRNKETDADKQENDYERRKRRGELEEERIREREEEEKESGEEMEGRQTGAARRGAEEMVSKGRQSTTALGYSVAQQPARPARLSAMVQSEAAPGGGCLWVVIAQAAPCCRMQRGDADLAFRPTQTLQPVPRELLPPQAT